MTRTKKPGRKTKCPKKEIFEHLYYLENISASEIAEIYGVNTQCVYNWAAKFRKESKKLDSNMNISDKQIYNRPTTFNYNKKRRGVKFHEQKHGNPFRKYSENPPAKIKTR